MTRYAVVNHDGPLALFKYEGDAEDYRERAYEAAGDCYFAWVTETPDPLKEVEYLEEALANAMEGYAAPQEAYEPLPESLRRGVHSTVFVMRMLHNDRPGWKQAGREDRVGEDELRSEQESRKPLRGHSESLCQMAEGLFFIGGIQRGVIFAPHRANRANRLLQSTSSDLECPTIQGAPSSTFCSSLARI